MEILVSLKLVKTCLFDALADGGLRTNHRDSEPGGPRINVCSFLLTSFVFSLYSHLHSLSLFILASSLLGDLVHHLASVRIIKLSSVCKTSTRCCKNKHYLDTSLYVIRYQSKCNQCCFFPKISNTCGF